MLGLGNTLITGGQLTFGGEYSSDFTTDTNGWGANSVQGTLTLQANQTIDSTGGWLKGTYDTNQTNTSGIIRNMVEFGPFQAGMDVEYGFKVFIPDLGGGEWLNVGGTGTSTAPAMRMVFNGGFEHEVVSYDTTTTVTGTSTTTGSDSNISFNFAVLDKPQAGAVFYVKDITYKVL